MHPSGQLLTLAAASTAFSAGLSRQRSMKSSLCLRRTSTLNFELPDLPRRNPCRKAITTSRLAPLSRMTSLHVYCSTVRSLVSCATAGRKPSPTRRAAVMITAPMWVALMSSSISIADAPAQQADASYAVSPKRDGAERRRLLRILSRRKVVRDVADGRKAGRRPGNIRPPAGFLGAVGAVDHRVAGLRHRRHAEHGQQDRHERDARHPCTPYVNRREVA